MPVPLASEGGQSEFNTKSISPNKIRYAWDQKFYYMLFLRKVHVKRFKQWENQATIAHIQNNYTREGQWFCSVQTLAQTRASQKSRACLKERQKTDYDCPLNQSFASTTGHNAPNPNVCAPSFLSWFLLPCSVISICALEGEATGVCAYQHLFVFSFVPRQSWGRKAKDERSCSLDLYTDAQGVTLTAVFTGAQLSPLS